MPVFHINGSRAPYTTVSLYSGSLRRSDQFLIEIKYGIWINRLFFHINCGIIGIYSKPRCTSCKSSLFLTIFLHAGRIVTRGAAGNNLCFRSPASSAQLYIRQLKYYLSSKFERIFFHAKLLTLINKGKSTKHEIQCQLYFFACITAITFWNIVTTLRGSS